MFNMQYHHQAIIYDQLTYHITIKERTYGGMHTSKNVKANATTKL